MKSAQINKMDEYYDTKKKKVWDFILGVIGFLIGNVIIYFIIFSIFRLILSLMYPNTITIEQISAAMTLAIILAINVTIVISSFKKGRRYIAIGMISGIFIPLLIFGACMGVFGIISLFG